MRCESKAEFEKLVGDVARETGEENSEFLGSIEGAQPGAAFENSEALVTHDDDDLARKVAAWCIHEEVEATKMLSQLMDTHRALAEATGRDATEIPVPTIAWDRRLSKSQIDKRRQGTA